MTRSNWPVTNQQKKTPKRPRVLIPDGKLQSAAMLRGTVNRRPFQQGSRPILGLDDNHIIETFTHVSKTLGSASGRRIRLRRWGSWSLFWHHCWDRGSSHLVLARFGTIKERHNDEIAWDTVYLRSASAASDPLAPHVNHTLPSSDRAGYEADTWRMGESD